MLKNFMISKKSLIILLVTLVAISVGVSIFSISTKQPSLTQQTTPSPSPIPLTPTPIPTTTQFSDWKTYRSVKYGFEFQYPTTWKVDEDAYFPFIQLQGVKNGEITAIVGGITIISKPISSTTNSPYEKMFVSNSRCPVVAGNRDLSSDSQAEAYVYCLTGKEIQTSTGTWKGAVECSASEWYGMKIDPNSCPHEFWIDTKDFFYVVHFNFFEPIKDGGDEAIFFDKFLKGFSFFTSSN